MRLQKLFCCLALSILFFSLKAQTVQYKPVPNSIQGSEYLADFHPLKYSAMAHADIDLDGDEDLVVCGLSTTNKIFPVTKLYLNIGSGSFKEAEGVDLAQVRDGDVAFSDVDNDGDPDLLVSGRDKNGSYLTYLYRNNGKGWFSLVKNTPFIAVAYSNVQFLDADNDGDEDLIVSGSRYQVVMSELYVNDGVGNFSKKTNSHLVGATKGGSDVADVDGDGDLDYVIMGDGLPSSAAGRLFINDGSGSFVTSTNLNSINGIYGYSKVKFGDIDNDTDPDMVFSNGQVFVNDGIGNFQEDTLAGLLKFGDSSLELFDFDQDNDLDVIITGMAIDSLTNFKTELSYLYRNSNGKFSLVQNANFIGVSDGSVLCLDVDGDQDKDLVISGGTVYSHNPLTRLYINIGGGDFSSVNGSFIPGFANGTAKFADVDGDNDLDLFTSGQVDRLSKPFYKSFKTCLYKNSGTGSYSLFDSSLVSGDGPVLDLADVDSDNDLDLFVLNEDHAVLDSNDGVGNFLFGKSLLPLSGGVGQFVDLDNDGDMDLFYSGDDMYNYRRVYIFKNNGAGNFIRDFNIPFSNIEVFEVFFRDIDNDSDIDFIIPDLSYINRGLRFFINDSYGGFTEKNSGINNPNVVDVIDLDGDSLPEIILRQQISIGYSLEVLKNLGSGNFQSHYLSDTSQTSPVSFSITDFDNDSDADVLIALGKTKLSYDILLNDGQGKFNKVELKNSFYWLEDAKIFPADIDGDGDKDLLFSGLDYSGEEVSRMYRQMNCSQAIDTVKEVGCNDFVWIENKVKYRSSGYYVDTLKSLYTCDSIITLDLEVISVDTVVNISSFYLMASARGVTYQWMDCNKNEIIQNETKRFFTPSGSGLYSVILTNSKGCSDTSSCYQFGRIGVDEFILENLVQIFPNPTNGEVNIKIDEAYFKGAVVFVTNTQGQAVIREQRIEGVDTRIKLPNLKALYFVNIKLSNGHVISHKILVE